MNYQTLLFDVDDTLLDFQDTEKQALRRLFQEVDVELTKETEALYRAVNHQRWRAYEKGELTRDQVVNERFGLVFEQLGKQVDSVAMEQTYRRFLNEGHQLLGNSLEIIRDLATKANLYVVTNGVSQTQHQRLQEAKLAPYFKEIFISEEVGYQKPMPEFFEHVFQKIPNLDKKKTLIIGDSLSSDILGGKNAGIDTVWLRAEKPVERLLVEPTYQIERLEELYNIF